MGPGTVMVRVYEANSFSAGRQRIGRRVLECATDDDADKAGRGICPQMANAARSFIASPVSTRAASRRSRCGRRMKCRSLRKFLIRRWTFPPSSHGWMKLNREAVGRGLPDWPLPEEIAHDLNCWYEDYRPGSEGCTRHLNANGPKTH